MEPLKVGDCIYRLNGGRISTHRIVIVRTTRTRAIDKDNNQFDILPRSDGSVHLKGDSQWSANTYHLETPKLKTAYENAVTRHRCTKYINDIISPTHIKTVPTDKLVEIVAAIKNVMDEK